MTKRMILLSVCFGLVFAGTVGAEARKKRSKLPLTTVTCGMEVKTSIRVANSLWDCVNDGLVVDGADITIDLNGQTIDGNGVDDSVPGDSDAGIDNSGRDYAGTHAGLTVKNGTVSQFQIGVVSGILPAARVTISGVTAIDSAYQGFSVAGVDGGNRITSNVAVGGAFGFNVDVTDGIFHSNIARQSSQDGMVVRGARGRIIANLAEDNTGDGMGISGGSTVERNVSRWNTGDGFNIYEATKVARNSAVGNGRSGFLLGYLTDQAVVSRNTASNNRQFGFYRNPTTTDGYGMRFSRNAAASNGWNGFEINGDDMSFDRDSAIDNAFHGFLTDGDNVRFSRVTAIGNDWEGLWVRSGAAPTVTRSTANRNGHLNGVSDGAGFGIRIEPTGAVASKNKAKGNDHADQCTANAGCNR
jgi:hypothetical protein